MIIYSPTFTGSVQITGSQTVTGDLTVQGNLTAQTFILSSSVSYFTESFASGSTRFGDSMDDTMKVTGSLLLTGSLQVSGAATFSSSVTANGTSEIIGGSGGTDWLRLTRTGVSQWAFNSNSTGLSFINNTSAVTALTLTSTGAVQISTNNVALTQKNAAGTGTIGLLRVGSDDKVQIGDGGTANPSVIYFPNGNVGIGTNSPTSSLNVVKSDNTTAAIGSFAANNLSQQTDIWYGGIRMGGTSANVDLNLASKGTGIVGISGAATFSSTISAGAATFSGKVIGNGFNSFSGDVSIASGATSTIYTIGDNGLYTVSVIVTGGSLIYSAAAIFYAHNQNAQYVKCTDLYDGSNVTLDNSGGAIRITNNGFTTLTWTWSVLYQRF